jgi:hypothetical protein
MDIGDIASQGPLLPAAAISVNAKLLSNLREFQQMSSEKWNVHFVAVCERENGNLADLLKIGIRVQRAALAT